MGLLDSVKSGLSSIGSSVSNAVDKVETKVSGAVSSAESTVSDAASKTVDFAKSEFTQAKDFAKVTGQKVESAVSHAVDEAKSFRLVNGQPPPHVGEGGKSDFVHGAQLETAVRNNGARNTLWTTDSIKADRDGFLKNVVQLDGIDKTKDDAVACGPTSFLMGMIAGRPESLPELGKKLLDPQGNFTPDAQKLLGKATTDKDEAPRLKAALTHIRDGKFSAADVTQLSEGLLEGTPGGPASGTNAKDLIALRASVTKLGVSVPRMELQHFGNPDGGMGHWRVGVDGKQYNPWPNTKGQSTIMSGNDAMVDGVSDGRGWGVAEKLYLDDNQVTQNVYSITSKATPSSAGQSWAVQSDPPLFTVNYQKQADGTFHRSGYDMSRMQQVSNNRVSVNDVNNLFPDVSPRV